MQKDMSEHVDPDPQPDADTPSAEPAEPAEAPADDSDDQADSDGEE